MSEPGELDRYWGEGPGQSPEPSTGASAAARAALTRSYLSEVTRQLAPGEEHGLHTLVGLVGDEHEEAAAQHGAQEAEDNQPPHSHTCAGAEEQSCRHLSSYSAECGRLQADASPSVWMQSGALKLLSFG